MEPTVTARSGELAATVSLLVQGGECDIPGLLVDSSGVDAAVVFDCCASEGAPSCLEASAPGSESTLDGEPRETEDRGELRSQLPLSSSCSMLLGCFCCNQ